MFDFSFANIDPTQNPLIVTWLLFTQGGWIFVVLTVLSGIWDGWKTYIRNKYESMGKHALLAVDIPKENEQSPKAVEHVFSHLYGIIKKGTLWDRYGMGYMQEIDSISFEVVSIAGYIQFLIRTPVKFRDLVEAAIYAQYPDAEITEVEDYVDTVPKPLELPHKDYDLWGTEYQFTNKNYYPIRTYPFFEHSMTQTFLDPMASFLEILGRLSPHEQVWYQLVISPIPNTWRMRGMQLIKKLIGAKDAKATGDWTYLPRQITVGLAESMTASLIPPTSESETAKKERQWPTLMQHLSPPERSIVEAVGIKISKLGFKAKMRFIYWGRCDVFDKPKAMHALSGAINQFNTQDLNGLRPHKRVFTSANYMFVKQRVLARQRRLLWGYRSRSLRRGRAWLILNTEELATLWHFPVMTVKAPSVQRAETKKAKPPAKLPTGVTFAPPGQSLGGARASAPMNLPVR